MVVVTSSSSNSGKSGLFRNVPPPAGRDGRERSANPYARFIPREELQGFSSWKPGSLDTDLSDRATAASTATTPAAPPPPPPTEADWLARIDEARRAGQQEGYQNGYRDGLVALDSFKQSFAAQTTAQVGALLARFDAEFDALQPQVAQAITQVAIDLARQVLKSELQTRPEVVAEVAAQATQAVLLGARHITVQVHPLDLPLVQQGAAEAISARGARVAALPALARGDVMIESDLGTIDARVATRWAQATAQFGHRADWQPDGGDEVGA